MTIFLGIISQCFIGSELKGSLIKLAEPTFTESILVQCNIFGLTEF